MGLFSSEVLNLLLIQQPRVHFPAFPKSFRGKIIDVAEVYQRCRLEESGQWLKNVNQTCLVLASGKPVLQKNFSSLNFMVRALVHLYFTNLQRFMKQAPTRQAWMASTTRSKCNSSFKEVRKILRLFTALRRGLGVPSTYARVPDYLCWDADP